MFVAMQDLALCSFLGRMYQMHTSTYNTVHWHIKLKPVHNNSPSLLEELPAAMTGIQSLGQFQGKVTTVHFYYKPATLVYS